MFKYSSLQIFAAIFCAISCCTVQAQDNRSAWMWAHSGHTYGSDNIIGDHAKEAGLISDFQLWGYDRIYTSLSSWPTYYPQRVAHWNAGLDDAGIQSQMLLGEPTWVFPGTRPSLLNIIGERLIDYNATRTDPRELIDAVHLDIEPHALTQWKNGTATDKRDLLLLLGDTYEDVRTLLDSNGQTQVQIYADLPVWYDSSTSIAWDAGERDQWFIDIADSLDGFSMMAYERDNFNSLTNGVGWEVANFNGEVRIGLESAAVGPGETWADFDELMDMAEQLEAYYGTDIGGIDFHPLKDFADLAAFSFLSGDVNGDGFVGITDLNVLLSNWNQAVEDGNWGQGDLAGNGDGFIGISDLNVILSNWNAGTPPNTDSITAIPEPGGATLLLGLISIGLSARHLRRS